MKNPVYRRLPGRRWVSASGQTSLWIGPDHVLGVHSTGFTESYRRFYLRDIAAIVVQRNSRWMIWNIVLGAMAGFLGLLALAMLGGGNADMEGFAYFLLVVFVAPSVLGLLANLLRGPTCTVRIQTAVQSAEVPSVGRLRAAEKLLAELVPLIQNAQPVAPPPASETVPPVEGASSP